MKKRQYMILSYSLCLLLIFNITGCWNRRELNTLAIVTGFGIDQAPKSNNIQLTAQIVNPSGLKKGEGSSGKAFWNAVKTGDTLFGTLRAFTLETNRKLYFPHIQVLILGRDLAEKGIQDEMDFFARDHEARMDIYLLVSESTAGEALDTTPELDKIPAMNISKLLEAQKATSESVEVTIMDFMSRLKSKTTDPIAPLLIVKETDNKKSVLVKGTAVFKKDKLVGELNNKETRGLLWILDEVNSGIIDVTCPEDENQVSLEILRSKTKITPEIIDDQIIMKIDIQEEGTIGAQYCPEEIVSQEKVKALEKKKSEAIEEEIMAALERAREFNADIFGFGDKVHQHYRDEWKDLEEDWDEIFPQVEIELTVDCKLRRSGRTTKPPVPEKE